MTTSDAPISLAMPIWDGLPIGQQLETIKLAEGLGYDTFWMGEAWGQEVFSTLAWLATHTTRIRLGVGIANVFSRTPALVAQSIATLDQISGGRAVLGLGTSGKLVVENWHGVPFTQSVQRMKEYADIVRTALKGERVNYDGEVFKLKQFRMRVKPVQNDLPIYFASISPSGIRATGLAADGWFPIWTTPDGIRSGTDTIRTVAAAAGRDPDAIVVGNGIHAMVSGDGRAREMARAHMAYYIGGMGVFYHQVISRQGFAADADAVRAAYLGGERRKAAGLVTDAMLDAMTLVGTEAECRARLDGYRAAGSSMPVIEFIHGQTPDQIAATLTALAPRRKG
jgi:F420-dependent oxidoreductase-like protein